MGLVLITAPRREPLTETEVKAHLRLDPDASDALVCPLIAAAREYVETFQERALLEQTWRLTLDMFPGFGWAMDAIAPGHHYRCFDRHDRRVIYLPRPRLMDVSSIQYVDGAGATQTLSTDDYAIDTDAFPGRILLGFGKSWPVTRCQRNAVTIEFTAGYGRNRSDVPERTKAAMKLLIGDWYENREGSIVGTSRVDNPAVASLLWPDRYIEAA